MLLLLLFLACLGMKLLGYGQRMQIKLMWIAHICQTLVELWQQEMIMDLSSYSNFLPIKNLWVLLFELIFCFHNCKRVWLNSCTKEFRCKSLLLCRNKISLTMRSSSLSWCISQSLWWLLSLLIQMGNHRFSLFRVFVDVCIFLLVHQLA